MLQTELQSLSCLLNCYLMRNYVKSSNLMNRTVSGLLCAVIVVQFTGCPTGPTTSPDAEKEASVLLEPDDPSVNGNEATAEQFASDSTSDVSQGVVEAIGEEAADIAASELVEPSGNWTSRRYIALASGGPWVIDLFVAVGQRSLEEVNRELIKEVEAELLAGQNNAEAATKTTQKMVTWKSLLSSALIQSGWLGNLVADENQTAQLIAMYDRDSNQTVSLDELERFLTRGLSGNSSIRFSDNGREESLSSDSPWGVIDVNQDNVLSLEEIEAIESSVQQIDLNRDRVIDFSEWQQAQRNEMVNSNSSGQSMLDLVSAIEVNPAEMATSEPQSEQFQKQMASKVVRHYTFLPAISRQDWSSWSDARWEEMDQDANSELNRDELKGLLTGEADAQVWIRLPGIENSIASNASPQGEEDPASTVDTNDLAVTTMHSGMVAHTDLVTSVTVPSITASSMTGQVSVRCRPASICEWVGTSIGGSLRFANGALAVQMTDQFGPSMQTRFHEMLGTALRNPEAAAVLLRQLAVSESALDLVDVDQDGELSTEEVERVWRWLSIRQGARVLTLWSSSASVWFPVIDRDGDLRITPLEMRDSVELVGRLDSNGDQLVSVMEAPLMARLEVKRSDQRLQALAASLPNLSRSDGTGTIWFDAMDINADGLVGWSEFLGSRDDFLQFDSDADGFIAIEEVYSQRSR